MHASLSSFLEISHHPQAWKRTQRAIALIWNWDFLLISIWVWGYPSCSSAQYALSCLLTGSNQSYLLICLSSGKELACFGDRQNHCRNFWECAFNQRTAWIVFHCQVIRIWLNLKHLQPVLLDLVICTQELRLLLLHSYPWFDQFILDNLNPEPSTLSLLYIRGYLRAGILSKVRARIWRCEFWLLPHSSISELFWFNQESDQTWIWL